MKKILIALMGAGLLVGCGGEEGTLRIESELAEPSVMSKVDSRLEMDTATDGGKLIIESVTIRVSEVELEGQNEDENEFETSGRTIDVALDGEPTDIAVESVPTGEYHYLGIEFVSAGAIVVQGSFEGEQFAYVSSLSPEIEWQLENPAVVAAGGEAGVAVQFDVGAWFVDSNGVAIDPRDQANRALIEKTIFDSITADAAEVERYAD